MREKMGNFARGERGACALAAPTPDLEGRLGVRSRTVRGAESMAQPSLHQAVRVGLSAMAGAGLW
jgi:hypothetical protein